MRQDLLARKTVDKMKQVKLAIEMELISKSIETHIHHQNHAASVVYLAFHMAVNIHEHSSALTDTNHLLNVKNQAGT